jgi:hypothetical protein
MKKAVIVIGRHGAGKSDIINEIIKPLLGIGCKSNLFTVENWNDGKIFSQSSEEKSNETAQGRVKKLLNSKYVITACRPAEELNSHFKDVKKLLKAKKYDVLEIRIENNDKQTNEKRIELAKKAAQHLGKTLDN